MVELITDLELLERAIEFFATTKGLNSPLQKSLGNIKSDYVLREGVTREFSRTGLNYYIIFV